MAVVVGSVLSLGVASAVGPAGVLADSSVDVPAGTYATSGAYADYTVPVVAGSLVTLTLAIDDVAIEPPDTAFEYGVSCDGSGWFTSGVPAPGGAWSPQTLVTQATAQDGDTECSLILSSSTGGSSLTIGAGSSLAVVDPPPPDPTPAPLCNDPAAPCYMAVTGPIELVAADRARLDRTTFAIVLAAGVGITLAGALVIGVGLRRR